MGNQAVPVSVIIPAYNAESYVGEAIESVLAQTSAPSEVIVVDDASTDGTAAIASSFGDRVQLIRQERAGANAARNLGVLRSSSSYISFLDADDLWTKKKLELQLEAFEADPAPHIVFGFVEQFRSPELDPDLIHIAEGAEGPMVGHHSGTMLLRREVFDSIGPFDPTIRFGQFIDWFSRAIDGHFRIRVIEDIVMLRRLHLSNMGRQVDAGPDQYAKALRLVLERRKSTSPNPG